MLLECSWMKAFPFIEKYGISKTFCRLMNTVKLSCLLGSESPWGGWEVFDRDKSIEAI